MKGIAMALGMFDSVHIGHKAVIEGILDIPARGIVITFDKIPHKTVGAVLSDDEKVKKILATGVDTVEILCFNEIKEMSPTEFLDMLTKGGKVKRIACGFNYRFGKNAEGDTAFLRRYCEEKGIEYFEAPEVKKNGITVSTTYIKKLLADGKVSEATELLGEPFAISGHVIKGERRGRELGFPTANIKYPDCKCSIKKGVYHVKVRIGMKDYDGVCDIGVRPTFDCETLLAETHIIGFKGDCYGQEIKLSFIEYLREEKKFDSPLALADAIAENVQYVKNKQRV